MNFKVVSINPGWLFQIWLISSIPPYSYDYIFCLKAVKCSGYKTCISCHKLPGCGWCDDGSGTGLGRCMDGGANGPFLSKNSIIPETCTNWFFMKCPGWYGKMWCDVWWHNMAGMGYIKWWWVWNGVLCIKVWFWVVGVIWCAMY